MIPNPNTIVDPGTMMIHLDDTSLTDTTMMGPVWFVRLTSSTYTFDSGRTSDGPGRTGWWFQQVILYRRGMRIQRTTIVLTTL